MTNTVHALAATERGGLLKPFTYELSTLPDDYVEIQVENCGMCHSDLSMLNNDWGSSNYPFVPGHEVVGKVIKTGSAVKGLQVGQRVGVGWASESCQHCRECLAGKQNLCQNDKSLIGDSFGGFADRVRCQWQWAIPLVDGIDPIKAGPLFCGGITVFTPIVAYDVKPTDRVGVIGIGGLGHLAVQFLNKWGCEVTAFSSSESKRAEAVSMGAHNFVSSENANALKNCASSLDYIVVTVNVPLDWEAYLSCLRPGGKLIFVGAVPVPISIAAFSLIGGQKSVGGSVIGSPATMQTMLEFCARHKIAPITEVFKMSEANKAFDHLRANKARYRIVLENDLA